MIGLLRSVWHWFDYDQKREWDRIAYRYFRRCTKIADIGCGEGRFMRLNPSKIVGVDYNDLSLSVCIDKGYEVKKSDIRNLPFKNHSMDGIHCSHVIEHFNPDDVHKILSEMDRVLKMPGILIIRSPLLWGGFYNDLTHIKPYNPYVIIKYMTYTKQRTKKLISTDYRVIYQRIRYAPLISGIYIIDHFLNFLNRWGFPWFKKNGYIIVLSKGSKK